MRGLSQIWNSLWKEELGQAVTEYAFILSIIAIGVCGALYTMRDPLTALYQSLSQSFSNLVGI